MSITNDWHHAHAQEDKYNVIEQKTIDYEPCAHCGTLIRPVPLKIAQKLYARDENIDPETIRHLCPKCRQLADAHRIENRQIPEPDNNTGSAGKGLEEAK